MTKTELKKYAKLIVRIGANVQKGQDVVINGSVSDEYFIKLVVEECYNAKANMVTVEWNSEACTRLTFKKASKKALSYVPEWQIERLKYRRDTLPAFIYIESEDPDYLNGIDPAKLAARQQAFGKAFKPIRKEMDSKYQWTIAAIPGVKWAKKVFPNESPKKAFNLLWEAIIKCARADGDPVKNWNEHNDNMHSKCEKLNNLKIDKLIYKNSLGTDFSIKMLEGLDFVGGGEYTTKGVYYNPNMPTEECFTSPDKATAEGVVYASKPLSLNGKVLKDFGFKFKEGKVVEVLAKDEEAKKALTEHISIDEGASMLGEVALVPFNSPVNESGILFFNTLFDENACCHLALGDGFDDCIHNFLNMSKEEIDKYPINESFIHTDFMIGTADLSIKAITKDNKEIEIFKNGLWAI